VYLWDSGRPVPLELRAAGHEEASDRAGEIQELRTRLRRVIEIPDTSRAPVAELTDLVGVEVAGVAGENKGVRPEAMGQSPDQRIGQASQPAAPRGDVHQSARVAERPRRAHDRHLFPVGASGAENDDSHATIIAQRCTLPS
jgi:hypothetical protein